MFLEAAEVARKSEEKRQMEPSIYTNYSFGTYSGASAV
jgi:hypothetical protein